MTKPGVFQIVVFCFVVLIPVIGYTQISIMNVLWVGQNNEYIKADSNIIRFETFSKKFGNTRIARFYSINGDTLKLVESNNDESGLTSDFLIKIIGSDQMTLKPLSSSAKQLTNLITLDGIKQILSYKEVHQFPVDSLKFEKIIFSSTECYGQCPVMSLEINSQKQIRFIGEKYTTKKGFFIGELSNDQYVKLLSVLKYSQLDLIECSAAKNIDLSTYALEIHYNGKMRNFYTYMLPFALDDLKDFILKLPGEVNLSESKNKFEIKFDPVLK